MNSRNAKDRLAAWVFRGLAIGVSLLPVPFLVCLYLRARPILAKQPLREILFSAQWSPMQQEFGMLPFLAGTVEVTCLAMLIAVPVSLLTAIFLSDYASRRVRRMVLPLIDLLSGIPSVIYGVWGIVAIVPVVSALAIRCRVYSSGYSLLAGSLVLAVMVSPFMIHVSREVLSAVPRGIRDASLSLGATRWQTVKLVVLRKALPGIVAAAVLGLSRAMGETIAVLMVVGNVPIVARSVFDPAYPLPSLLANNYGEMMSMPLYDSALLLSALVLLLIVISSNLTAKAVLVIAQRGST